MATGKQPRKKKTDAQRLYSRTLKVPCGTEERGYMAGTPHGVNGHRTHAHQPCLADYTDGELQCPYCAAGLETIWRAYVPIWDRDWSLRHALIGQDIAESVDAIPHGHQVRITRAKNPISPLVIRAEQCLTRALPTHAPYSAPVDVELICLTLWKCDALDQWVLSRRAKGLPTARPAPLKSDGKEFTPMLRGAAQRYAAPAEPVDLDKDYEAVAARLRATAAKKEPSTNGKRKRADHA